MVKGWKLNPEWIRLYEERKEKELKRMLEKIEVEQEITRITGMLERNKQVFGEGK